MAVQRVVELMRALRDELVDELASRDPASLRRATGRMSLNANTIFSFRRRRDQIFEFPIFAEPAWDILLDLYIAQTQQQRVKVSSVGISSGIPQATAHRWIGLLEHWKLIERELDPSDKRRIFLKLTRKCAQKFDRLFERATWDSGPEDPG